MKLWRREHVFPYPKLHVCKQLRMGVASFCNQFVIHFLDNALGLSHFWTVKNAAGQNGYDALLSFTGADKWNACAIMEAGGVHANSAGFFDNVVV